MTIVPKPIRQIVYKIAGANFYEKLRYAYYKKFVPNAGYDCSYYESNYNSNAHVYDLLAEALTAEFHPLRLVDAGCGNGGISAAFISCGCESVMAFDGSADAVKIARSRGIASAQQLDFIEAKEIPASGDLCICCEVAEHIPEKYSSHFCELLSKPAPVLAFTAAPPGQGGHLHVNLKSQSWWIEKMSQYGMVHDPAAVQRVRSRFNGKMIRDYDENLMIFRKKAI